MADEFEAPDVIIVGAGPAGCVLASRLSENPHKRVLLLEAGPDAHPGTEHPDIKDPFPVSTGNPAFWWPGLTALSKMRHSDRFGQPLPYLQAWGIGGASNINGMAADRGSPDDFKEWEVHGAEGWAWENVLPYFRKLENDHDFRADIENHGNDGPMPVRRLPREQWGPFARASGVAFERAGYRMLGDFNTDFRSGFGDVPTNSLASGRVSAAMAYLPPNVRRRGNLKIIPHARAERLRWDGLRVTGVEAEVNGHLRTFTSSEAILSGGAIQTPALLMRSGVGPAAELNRLGIDVIADLCGVGANLQNHPMVPFTVYLRRRAVQQGGNQCFIQTWLRYSSSVPRCEANDMLLMVFNKTAWHTLGKRVAMLAVSVGKSYSKGSVRLSEPSARSSPQIDFNLLSDPRDFDRLVEGARFMLELLVDPAVMKMRGEIFLANPAIVGSLSQRTAINGYKSAAIAALMEFGPVRRIGLRNRMIDAQSLVHQHDALREFVGDNAQPVFHVCGTCRMGSQSAPGNVVDSCGRVIGIEHLRIADASIFPTIPRANLHFTVIMAAEKIADLIKEDWKN